MINPTAERVQCGFDFAPRAALYHSPYVPHGAWLAEPLEAVHGQPPARLRPWLLYPGSLTAALKQESRGCLAVRVLSQSWRRPAQEERRTLGLRPRQLALVREVLLCGSGVPWVYARSVLPMRSLQGKSRYLRSLDDRPLGELLFCEADMRRGPILLNQLRRNPDCRLAELEDAGDSAWGRRSTFWLRDKPLLVAETFLSSFRPAGPPCTGAAGQQPSDIKLGETE
ncbi:chorismate lyase [Microbulbifer sp. TYP-18]|uniref:chorismate--pyruvate lyase family protein n=1 Tax=Microbulbifer sp. TYP-18 TaxID=3230024 RepID=UPI0034C65F28